jgi:hypothetical protein
VTRDSRYVIFFYRTIHRNCESMKIYNCFEFNDGLCITDNHAGISSVGKSMCVACQPLHTIRVDRRTLGGTGWRTKKSTILLWIPNRRVRVDHFRGKKNLKGGPGGDCGCDSFNNKLVHAGPNLWSIRDNKCHILDRRR